MRKICIVTTSRADYGLLRNIIRGIASCSEMTLQLVVGGSHLLEKHGNSIGELTEDGFEPSRIVHGIGGDDSTLGQTLSASHAVAGFGQAFEELSPDIILFLGDRFEILAAGFAARLAGYPIAHIHGGEVTTGAMDDAFRHALTKMSHIHFVATKEFKNRCIQMGESPDTVHVVGGLGVDNISSITLLDKQEIEAQIDFMIDERTLLVTFHPATNEPDTSLQQMRALLKTLEDDDSLRVIFSLPNIDHGSSEIISLKERFSSTFPERSVCFPNLGFQRYLSVLNQVAGVVGNSSSGILEAPTLKTATVNIGSRQNGRPRAGSVIDCAGNSEAIRTAIEELFDPEFQRIVKVCQNPYGTAGASKRIVNILSQPLPENLPVKLFCDVEMT